MSPVLKSGVFRIPISSRGLADRVQNGPGQPRRFDPPAAADAVMFAFAEEMIFQPPEGRQHVIPAPAGQPELAPVVVVGGLAAHRDHGIDGGAAADHLATWIGQRTAIEAGLGLGPEHPVRAWIADRKQVSDRDVKPDPVVAATGLQDQDALGGIGRQAIGDNAAGGAGADDNIVKITFKLFRHLWISARLRRPSCRLLISDLPGAQIGILGGLPVRARPSQSLTLQPRFFMPIINRVADLQPDIQAWRRDIHQHPELLYDVHRTAAFVADRLREFGCDEVATGLGRTGVVGVIKGRKPKGDGDVKVIGLRADMDALPIEEQTNLRLSPPRRRARCMPAAMTGTPRCCSARRAISPRPAISPATRW